MKVIKLSIPENESEGLELISLVDVPAHLHQWHAFTVQSLTFSTDTMRRWVTGVFMIPNKPIYRNSGGREWMAVFSADDIRKMGERFMKVSGGLGSTINHDSNRKAKAFLVESYFTDVNRGIVAPKWAGDLPNGTWVGSYKIEDDKTWGMVLSGEINGFSVEGMFDPKDLGEYERQVLTQLNNTIKQHDN